MATMIPARGARAARTAAGLAPLARWGLPLLLVLLAGCATQRQADGYEIGGRKFEGPAAAGAAIAESANAEFAARAPAGARPTRLLHSVPPSMPRQAIEREITGLVRAQLVVDTDGKVVSVTIVQSPHELLSQAVRQALAQWRFAPAASGTTDQLTLRQAFEFRVAP